jgi:hypothetical protein
MPFDGNGNYSPPAPAYPAVSGQVIYAADWNEVVADIASGLSNAVTRDGQSPPNANLPMGGKKITGLGAGTVAGDALRYEQVFAGNPAFPDGSTTTTQPLSDNSTKLATTAYVDATALAATLPNQTGNSGKFITTDGTNASWDALYTRIQNSEYIKVTTAGTSTAYTAAPSPTLTAYSGDGTCLDVVFHTACGAAPTFEIHALGALPLGRQQPDGSFMAFKAGEIPANWRSRVRHMGTYFVLQDPPLADAPVSTSLSFRSKVRNGKLEITQRGTSFAAAANGSYTLDGWALKNTSAAVMTVAQASDAPADNEFQFSLRATITTADAALAAGDVAALVQPIEGYLVRDLLGKPVAIQFRVRSSKVGTHSVALRNSGLNRSYILTYTVSVANTWETKTLSLPEGLITAGTWDWTTGTGVFLTFTLAAGTTYHGASANSWLTGDYYAVAGQVNCLDTIGNIFAITGVQMERGFTPGPFEHRDPSTEIGLNQRYLWAYIPTGAMPFAMAAVNSTSNVYTVVYFPVEMRIAPSLSTPDVSRWSVIAGTVSVATTGVTINGVTKTCAEVVFGNSSAPFTVGNAGWVRSFDAAARLYASAELAI